MISTIFVCILLLMAVWFVYSLGRLPKNAALIIVGRASWEAYVCACAHVPVLSVGHTWWWNHSITFCLHGSIVSTEGWLTQLSKCGKLAQCPASVSLGLSLSSSWGHITFPGVVGARVLMLVCCAWLTLQGESVPGVLQTGQESVPAVWGHSLFITVLQVDPTAQSL